MGDMDSMEMSTDNVGHGMMHNMPRMNGPAASSMGHPLKRVKHGFDWHDPGAAAVAMTPRNRLNEPGNGLEKTESRVLVYSDLRSLSPCFTLFSGCLRWNQAGRDFHLSIPGQAKRYLLVP